MSTERLRNSRKYLNMFLKFLNLFLYLLCIKIND
nr:MAG TPA: hypothetical protein [Caudoviricetes sp.]DAV36596.1 MAG TPA: hypothetical protein [Bacteriophage sp.]